MEQKYWKQLGDKPRGSVYVSAGFGMGEVLSMAAEMHAYTLSDRPLLLLTKRKQDCKLQCSLIRVCSIPIALSPLIRLSIPTSKMPRQ